MNNSEKSAHIYALLAGACDGLTGILLLAAPVFTLKLMGIHTLPAEPVYMQWIGAFVFGVGFSYFLPFLTSDPNTRRRRLISLFEFTACIRFVIAAFTGISIMRGALDAAWMVVSMTDLTLASIQIVFLKMNVLGTAKE